MSGHRRRAASVRLTLATGAAAGLGCSSVADLSPDPYVLVAESAFRNAAIDAPCEVPVTEWWTVFGDVRLRPETPVIDGAGVETLARRYAHHHTGARFRDPGATTLEQLGALTVSDLDAAWAMARARAARGDLAGLAKGDAPDLAPAGNPVATFLLHHVTALRLAARAHAADTTDVHWTLALVHETAALGYLLDAMSADRMLTPRARGPFAILSRNRDASASYFASAGVFALDEDGNAWQAFGRRHLEWYRAHLCRVMSAAQRAVRELALVVHVRRGRPLPEHLRHLVAADVAGRSAEAIVEAWLTSRPGPAWLEEERLPSLRAIPSPVWATWRLKHGEPDDAGIRPATHFAQLAADSLHDPTIAAAAPPFGDGGGPWHAFITHDDLRGSEAVPSWRSPRDLLGGDVPRPVLAQRTDPDLAVVRFVQRRAVPPSLAGLFVSAALLGVANDAELSGTASIGYLGRAVIAGSSVWGGVAAQYRFPAGTGGGRDLATNLVAGYSPNLFRPGGWLELGPLWDLTGARAHGVNVKLAWLPGTIALPFLYAGLTPRLEATVVRTDETRLRFGAALLLH